MALVNQRSRCQQTGCEDVAFLVHISNTNLMINGGTLLNQRSVVVVLVRNMCSTCKQTSKKIGADKQRFVGLK